MKLLMTALILIGSHPIFACEAMNGIADYDFSNSPIGFLSMVLDSKELEEAIVKHDIDNIDRQVGYLTLQSKVTMVPREDASPIYKIDMRWSNACSISYSVKLVDMSDDPLLCGTPVQAVLDVDENNLPAVRCLEGTLGN